MRGVLWLLGAGGTIAAGGYLMTLGDAGAVAHKQRDDLDFPTYQRPADVQREAGQRTLAPAGPRPG